MLALPSRPQLLTTVLLACGLAGWCMVGTTTSPPGARPTVADRGAPTVEAPPAAAPPVPAAAPPEGPVAPPVTSASTESQVHDLVWSAIAGVTDDGSQIFVPIWTSDGARGGEGLVFHLRDRKGRLLRELVVADVEENMEPAPSPGERTRRAAREAAAVELLAELQRKKLHPLDFGRLAEPPDVAHASYRASGDHAPSITFALSPDGTLTVTPSGHGPITRRDPSWRTAPTAEERRAMEARWNDGKEACFNPAVLRVPEVDLARRIALVRIGYHGNDTCWEPSDTYTVVTW